MQRSSLCTSACICGGKGVCSIGQPETTCNQSTLLSDQEVSLSPDRTSSRRYPGTERPRLAMCLLTQMVTTGIQRTSVSSFPERKCQKAGMMRVSAKGQMNGTQTGRQLEGCELSTIHSSSQGWGHFCLAHHRILST